MSMHIELVSYEGKCGCYAMCEAMRMLLQKYNKISCQILCIYVLRK